MVHLFAYCNCYIFSIFVSTGTYQRKHSPDLIFGCSVMEFCLQLKSAQPGWWRKHLHEIALESNLLAGLITEEEVS